MVLRLVSLDPMPRAHLPFLPVRWLCHGLSLAIAAACSAPPGIDGHRHRHTVTLTIADQAMFPAAEVTIPAFATVVWRNGGTLPIVVEVEAAACNACETVLGFAPTDQGVRSVSIPPQGVATLCFHEAGRFAFLARGNGADQHGIIVVGGEQ